MVSSILPKKRTKLTILSMFFDQYSEFCSFFGKIEETIICFQDCLTFGYWSYKPPLKEMPIEFSLQCDGALVSFQARKFNVKTEIVQQEYT